MYIITHKNIYERRWTLHARIGKLWKNLRKLTIVRTLALFLKTDLMISSILPNLNKHVLFTFAFYDK